MKEFIEFIAKQLVDHPDKVSIEETTVEEGAPDEKTIEYILKVDSNDIGKVIGRHGKTIDSMRILIKAVGAKAGYRARLTILD